MASSPHTNLSDEFVLSMQEYEGINRNLYRGRIELLDMASDSLANTFRRYADDFCAHEKLGDWERWLGAQAWIFWQYRDAPENQQQNAVNNDKMQAKRYLGYLIADDLIKRLLEPNFNGCPKTLLSAEHIKYLISLSVEEFARIRAYFVHRAVTSSEDNPSQTEKEYYTALNYVNKVLTRFPIHKSNDCNICGKEFLTKHHAADPDHSSEDCIKSAKRNALYRLGLNNDAQAIAIRNVEGLYPWLKNGTTHNASPEQAWMSLKQHAASTNMFEFFLMCFLACKGYKPKNTYQDRLE